MPRTKQMRKTRSSRDANEASASLVKDFERQCMQQIRKFEADSAMQIMTLKNAINVAVACLPTEIRKLTIGELLAMDLNSDANVAIETADESSEVSSLHKTVSRPKKTQKRATAASDDGYATESTTTRGTHVSRMNATRNSDKHQPRRHRSSSNNSHAKRELTRISRSSSRSGVSKISSLGNQENRNNLLKTAGRCPAASSYKTPGAKKTANQYGLVTPKIEPNTPINVLRRPRQGEMVLSMQGSPLLVSSIVQERTANINVPLQNGDVLSLLPNPGLRLSTMPQFDSDTTQQLKTLQNHLNKYFTHKKK